MPNRVQQHPKPARQYGSVAFTSAGGSDVGRVRPRNEDAYLVLPEAGAFVVADGMGGQVAGDLAAGLAVATLRETLARIGEAAEPAATAILSRAIIAANDEIFHRTLAEDDKRGMGTTLTALALSGSRYAIGHVGDSRAYVMRDDELRQITKDHSWVQEQVDAGYLTTEQARTHPYVSVISRCVGTSPEVEPDVYAGSVRPGDVFLLATDGLTKMLDDDEILWLMMLKRSPRELVDGLIAEANRMGGLDNIAVVAVRIEGTDGRFASGATPPSAAARRAVEVGGGPMT